MTDKPRIRVPAWRGNASDSFQNLQARLGEGSGNLMDGATYALTNLITRMPRQLEFMYRGSWVVGAVCDSVADDMTRAGVDFGAALRPDVVAAMTEECNDLEIWTALGDTERWARLYGGAIGVIMIDGQDVETPLRTDAIAKGSFKGVTVLDRWSLILSPDQLLAGMGPNIGRPEFYRVGPNAPALVGKKVHHSRVIRREGIRLPFVQRQAENSWGLSVVERMYDRLLAFDSSTTGAAQLVFKAYLRTLKKKGLNQILAAGGPALEALAKNVEQIRRFQSTEGMTLIDAEDEFATHAYTFAGLDDLLLQFGQQLSGATEIPLVRLFGQSPAGLNSTGESDIRNYYDGINAKQERHLRPGVNKVLKVLHKSVTGEQVPPGFTFKFNPLWQLKDEEKANVAKTTAEAVAGAYDAALITAQTALRELRQSSEVTGIFSNITDEDIEAADDTLPEPEPAAEPGDLPAPPELKAGDAMPTVDLHGLRLVIETPRGDVRQGGSGLRRWQVVMPADYGFIDGTWSAEGKDEEMDCFVGPDPESPTAWVIDQRDLATGAFDEHKVMLGYRSQADALFDYLKAYHDGRAFDRIIGVTQMPIADLKVWLQGDRLDQPLANAA